MCFVVTLQRLIIGLVKGLAYFLTGYVGFSISLSSSLPLFTSLLHLPNPHIPSATSFDSFVLLLIC